MRTIVQCFARPPVFKPVPVIGMNVIHVCPAWRRSLPQVPIKLCRNRCFLADAYRLSRVAIPAFGKICPADESVVYFVDRFHRARARSLLCALLHVLLVLLLSLHQHRSLGWIMASWLFNIDVLARLKSRDGERRMPVIGSGDGDGIYVLLLKNGAKVLVAGGSISQLMFSDARKLGQNRAVHIAHMRNTGGIFIP